MKVAFYLGTHGTEPERMIKVLMQNREWLLANGIEPVPPSRHRGMFEEALSSLSGGPATPGMEQVMLDAILDIDDPKRLICSQAGLIGVPARCLAPPSFYALAGSKMMAAANLFPSADAEFFMALRNPATLVPHLAAASTRQSYDQLMAGRSPDTLRWGPAVRQMLQSIQGRRLVLWCHEDTPLIWPEVVRRIADMPTNVALKGGLAVLAEVLTTEGLDEIKRRLVEIPQVTIAARRDIFAEVLATHARPDMLETSITMPGWDQALVDRMTRDYDDDIAEIAALPGVEFIVP